MAEKPILFNTEMVKAILDGRKTQTRRVIKPQPPPDTDTICGPEMYEPAVIDKNGELIPGKPIYGIYDKWGEWGTTCPYQPGNILWVKETWRIGAWNENMPAIAVDYKADGFARREWLYIEDEEAFERYRIQSTEDAIKAGVETDADGKYCWEPGEAPTRWRPSIHMPRAAARLFLEVTDVRVERVQDITLRDILCEGIEAPDCRECFNQYGTPCCKNEESECGLLEGSLDEFISLWDSIYAKNGYGWLANPYVWVIEFKRCES